MFDGMGGWIEHSCSKSSLFSKAYTEVFRESVLGGQESGKSVSKRVLPGPVARVLKGLRFIYLP